MIAQGKLNSRPPPAEAKQTSDDGMLDRQRSGSGFLAFLIFPMISIAAIAYAGLELVR